MIKRIDRTNVLMADLEKSATAGVKEAAIMLKVIAREMVSRKYVKTAKQKAFDDNDRGPHWGQQAQTFEKNLAKALARRRFTGQATTLRALIEQAKAKT